jgi:hypothetical protein
MAAILAALTLLTACGGGAAPPPSSAANAASFGSEAMSTKRTSDERPVYILGTVFDPVSRRALWSMNDERTALLDQDDDLLVVVDRDDHIETRDLGGGHTRWRRELPRRPHALHVTRAGVVLLDGASLVLLARTDGAELRRTVLPSAPTQVAFGSGPTSTVALELPTSFVLVDPESGKTMQTVPFDTSRPNDGASIVLSDGVATDIVHEPAFPVASSFDGGFVHTETKADGTTRVVAIDDGGRLRADERLVGANGRPPRLAHANRGFLAFNVGVDRPRTQIVRLGASAHVEPPLDVHADEFLDDDMPSFLRVDDIDLVLHVDGVVRWRSPGAMKSWDASHAMEAVRVGSVICVLEFGTASPDTWLVGIDALTGAQRYRERLAVSSLYARRPFQFRNASIERAGGSVVVTIEELGGIVVEGFDAITGARWFHEEGPWHDR